MKDRYRIETPNARIEFLRRHSTETYAKWDDCLPVLGDCFKKRTLMV